MKDLLVFVVAKQRSGTNLLRKSLASTGAFYDVDEIFHNPGNSQSGSHLYWNHFFREVEKNSSVALPTATNQDYLLDSFFKNEAEKIGGGAKQTILVDVKYNSTMNNNLLWHSPLDVPYLLKYIKKRGFRVVHLVRRNVFDSYLSAKVAAKNKIWHVSQSDEGRLGAPVKVYIPIAELVREMRIRKQEIHYFRQRLTGLEIEHLELYYDELIEETDPATLSGLALDKISRFLGKKYDRSLAIVPLKKIVQHGPDAIIENFAEVRAALEELEILIH